ncbi:MAG: hypothetical protein J5594_02455 [Elusimicrobiaceae bacterium]|nr:hypothetical protein [Elusimicrobiaceae bacterium]
MATPLLAGGLHDDIEFDTKLKLFASKANVPNNFLSDYKAAYLKLDVDFAYHVNENLSFNFLPYARTSYYSIHRDKTQTDIKIWQAYLNYQINNFDFYLGRFDFVDERLAPFIYYGDNLSADLALPTSLDGLKHKFTGKYIDYSLLLVQESQIENDTKAKLSGTNITAKPLSWLNISGFYFYQNKKYSQNTDKINSKLFVFGAGIDLFLTETSGLHFYGAKNGGEKETIKPSITRQIPYKGYAFNGEFYSQNVYKTGILNNKLGFYVFSDKEKFYSFPNKLQTGIIYGGMNYDNVLPASPQIFYAILDFNFSKYSFLYSDLGVFVYSSGKDNINNRNYYAKEINLNVGFKFDTWGLKLSGGLFEGEALFLGGTTTEKQKIKKLQANLFYKFTL